MKSTYELAFAWKIYINTVHRQNIVSYEVRNTNMAQGKEKSNDAQSNRDRVLSCRIFFLSESHYQ